MTEKEQFYQPGYEPPDPGAPVSGSRGKSPSGSGDKRPSASGSRGSSADGEIPPVQLDAIDIRILNLLQEDGRLSVRELAKKAGLSPTPVHERLKKLESSGIIDHYAAVINTGKIGQMIVFFVNIVLKEHSTRLGGEFIREITAFPEVVEFHVIGGEHDFMIKVIVPDMAAYRRFFVQQLGEIPNIAKLQSIIVLDTPKKDNRIPL
jgi:Lrp/AsnC family leucine-responsive transcriptional regulator